MARDPLSDRCTLLLSETVTIRDILRTPSRSGAAVETILACREMAIRQIERVEKLEQSDRLDRRRQELITRHEPS